jgi:hypothetical protein
MSGVSRLRTMSHREISWRARQQARIASQRMAVRVRPPRWNRADVYDVLAEGVLDDLSRVDRREQWSAVHAELAHRITNRSSLFALDPSSAPDMRQEVLARWPTAASDAATRADRILADRYDVLGYRQLEWTSPEGKIDWHLDPVSGRSAPLHFWADVPYLDAASGDHKVIWELNRHQHWLSLGRALWLTRDARYRRGMIGQLQDWMAANPPLLGINWASMLEIALRTISWTWGLHFLLGEDAGSDPPWLVDLLIALNRQLTHVEHNLSIYFSPNTHLTGEALGLYVVGAALPELVASSRWSDTGRRILVKEVTRQIRADGGHVERSTHYQRYTLDFYLMALVTAERTFDDEAAAIFREAATRLAEYTQAMADDLGRLPTIGDDDGGMLWPIAGRACHDVRDSLSLAALLLDRPDLAPWNVQEEAVWIAGPQILNRISRAQEPRLAVPMRSHTLADSGFVVVRDTSGSHATFDVGRCRYLDGPHAHAAALSITLAPHGRPLLVDPGTSTYTMDARLRDRLRSTMGHNTVTIDDRAQAIPRGPFHWRGNASGQQHGSRSNEAFAWAEASHDAYLPLRHRRTIVATPAGRWLIADEVLGEGLVTARAHWHLDPAWKLRRDEPGRLHAVHDEGDAAWLLHEASELLLAHGDDESGLGWYAPVYGMLVPTWTARTTRTARAPFAMLTAISARTGRPPHRPSLDRLETTPDAGGIAIGARVVDAFDASVFLLRPGDTSMRDNRACRIADYQTDARVLHYREAAGRLLTLDLVDASQLLALRDGWLSVDAAEGFGDLHVAVSGDRLDMYSSAPPPHLRLQGGALRQVRRVCLNRRDVDVPASDDAGTVVVCGVDWAAPAGQRAWAGPFGPAPDANGPRRREASVHRLVRQRHAAVAPDRGRD